MIMSNVSLSEAESMLGICLGNAWLLVNAYSFFIILSIYLLNTKGYWYGFLGLNRTSGY
jgi:L-amino acid N-acyltransferase YncA